MSTAYRRRRVGSSSDSDPSPSPYSSYPPPGGSAAHPYSSPPPPPAVGHVQDLDMTCRDRTNEFMSAVKSMQSRQVRICFILGLFLIQWSLNTCSLCWVHVVKTGQDLFYTRTVLIQGSLNTWSLCWQPIAHPWGWGMGCLVWGQSLKYVLSNLCSVFCCNLWCGTMLQQDLSFNFIQAVNWLNPLWAHPILRSPFLGTVEVVSLLISL